MTGYTPHSDDEEKVVMNGTEAYQEWLSEYSEMTLDEAIHHATETAENRKAAADFYDKDEDFAKECYECAAQHEQLVKWLKELKEVKEVKGDAISRDLVKKDIVNQINDFEELDKCGGHYENFTDMKPILFGLQIGLTIIDNSTTLRPVKNVLYTCDQKKCEKCTASENLCFMTTDVSHAVSFEEIYKGVFAERTHSDSYNAGFNEARAKFERTKSSWIDCSSCEHWKCSNCGYLAPYTNGGSSEWLSDFCPSCGAEMVNEEGSERQ